MGLEAIYNIVTDDIIGGQCVLFLGSELLVSDEGKYYKSFFKEYAKANNSLITKYFPTDNLFAFTDETSLAICKNQIEKFYRNVGDKVLLEMISKLKLPLIINVSPDISLNNTYKQKKIPFKSAFFSTPQSNAQFTNLPYPTNELPIVYNIFGSVENSQSLILTHDKLYTTIKNLMQEGSLPTTVQNFIDNANSFIFLGFKFDTWYYQLLLSKLGIAKSRSKIGVPNIDNLTDTVSIMTDFFNIHFTAENPVQTISSIISTCEKKDPSILHCEKMESKQYGIFISYARNDEKEDKLQRLLEFVNALLSNTALEFEDLHQAIQNILNKLAINPAHSAELAQSLINVGPNEVNDKIIKWYEEYNQENKEFDDREAIVKLIREKIKEREQTDDISVQLFVDRTEITYGDSIDSFMNRIGKGKTVIRIISDKYLKSRFCMDEAMRIEKYNDEEKRVFNVVLGDAKLSVADKIEYKKYWDNLIQNIYQKIDATIDNTINKERAKKNYGIYIDIYDFIDGFIEKVSDAVHLQASSIPPDHLDDFIDAIIKKLQ